MFYISIFAAAANLILAFVTLNKFNLVIGITCLMAAWVNYMVEVTPADPEDDV